MKDDAEKLYALLNSFGGIFWEAQADMQLFFSVSNQLISILAEDPAVWISQKNCWADRIHPEDREIIVNYQSLAAKGANNKVFNYRMVRNDGQIVWLRDTVSTFTRADGTVILQGFMLDVSVVNRLQALEQLERRVLRLNAHLNVPLKEVLTVYLKGLEYLFPQMHCSVHLIKNGRLGNGIAPSLAPEYISAMTGRVIGQGEGSCSSAAASGRQVIVSDIATDHRWSKYREFAMSFGLRACWSNPIVGSDGEVIATLAMYYMEPKTPDAEERKVMEKATALLYVILEHRQKTEQVQENNLLMLQSQELAHFGNWRWEVQQDVVTWSPALYTIYGLDRHSFKATFAGYQELLHPDDRDRIYKIIENVLHTGEDGSFEERIIRPGGEIRYLRSWAKLKKDAQGRPLEMIGACLDITEAVQQRQAIEQQNRHLLDIAWTQSHVIRAPLARLMSLIDLIDDSPEKQSEQAQLLSYLRASALELDEQVRLVCRKTELLEPPGELSRIGS